MNAKLVQIFSLAGTEPNIRVDLRTRKADGTLKYGEVQPHPLPGTLHKVEIKQAGSVCGCSGPKVPWLYWRFTVDPEALTGYNRAYSCGYSGERMDAGAKDNYLQLL